MSQQPYDPSPPPYGPPPPKGKGPLVAGSATVLVLLVVVAGLVIVLLTRDGDDDPGPVAEPTTRTPSEKPSPDSEDPTDAPSTGSGGSGGSGDLTPPGTTLALGESATVPVTNGPGANGVVKADRHRHPPGHERGPGERQDRRLRRLGAHPVLRRGPGGGRLAGRQRAGLVHSRRHAPGRHRRLQDGGAG
ncbi:hypothetical protein G5V59_24440 [Nocardioides sp. W3-2-3]|uniref:hypothetical protein n=1 Tax=Nocardioides convexus TaxID=2712224 RepID=UPI0024185F44|nr:hypothetical protein [Nocardioides convexus]NHA01782.1 hypothetical protein [Nocardioides convexus]